jgi:NTE family protein
MFTSELEQEAQSLNDFAPHRPSSDPTFAIALGGGGARGLAHIHVIEALDELGIRPVAIAGSSIGAIMGAGMAAGMTGRQIHDYSRAALERPSSVAGRMWRARPGSVREMVSKGFRLGQFNIERILRAFLPEQVPATFEELEIPLSCTATDYYAHSLTVFDRGDLHGALAASAAIPGIFRPVTRDGRLYVDGGFYNPVPFDLLEGKADIVIAVDVVGAPVEGPKPPTTIDLIYGASQLMMQSIIASQLRNHKPPQIFLRPAVSRFRVLDFLKIDAVLQETADVKDELKRAIDKVVADRAAARRA